MKVKMFSMFLPLVMFANSLFNINSNVDIIEKKLEEDTRFIKVEILYPNIEGNNKKIQKNIDKLNNKIKSDIDTWIKDLKDLSVKSEHESDLYNVPFRQFQIFSTYKVALNKENILSIPVEQYQDTGGAHGLTTKISYNFDLNTGTTLKLKDLFKNNYNYKEAINNEIKKQISEKSALYFDDGKSFKGIKENQDFYITEDGIVVYFQLYEIAPYSSGIREFKIPFSLVKDGI